MVKEHSINKLIKKYEDEVSLKLERLHASELRMLDLQEAIQREAGCGLNAFVPRIASLVAELQDENEKHTAALVAYNAASSFLYNLYKL